jgi:ankyrin repeat protein
MMAEEHKEDMKYIVVLLIVTAVIAGIMGYGYYERQRRNEAFFLALLKKDIQSVNVMLKKDPGLIFARRKESDETPLFYIASKEMAELLIAAGAETNIRDRWGRNPLHKAVIFRDQKGYTLMEYLLTKGIDVTTKDNHGSTPLHVASDCRNAKAVEILLAHHADVNARDNAGYTPLHYALYGPFSHSYAKASKATARILRKYGGIE